MAVENCCDGYGDMIYLAAFGEIRAKFVCILSLSIDLILPISLIGRSGELIF